MTSWGKSDSELENSEIEDSNISNINIDDDDDENTLQDNLESARVSKNSKNLLKILARKYVDTASPIAYSDAKSIYEYFRGKLKMKQILDFLSTKDAYTLTKRTRRARYYNMTYVNKRRDNIQLDVFYMQEFQDQNDNIRHILVGLDVWSRYMWACPLKSTSAAEGLRGTKIILESANELPKNLTLDKGSEFVSNKYKNYIRSLKIKLFYTSSKASIVERSILTLKRYIYRYIAETDQVRYIDKLQHFVSIYNNHFHRFLNMSPKDAEEKKNQKKVKKAHDKRKNEMRNKRQRPRFKVGDKVRLSRIKNRMTRGFDNTHNYEVFQIYKVNLDLPIPRYYVKQSETDEKIDGCFYGNEIVLVRQHKFKITILKDREIKGKKEYFVKWKGYPGKFHFLYIDL